MEEVLSMPARVFGFSQSLRGGEGGAAPGICSAHGCAGNSSRILRIRAHPEAVRRSHAGETGCSEVLTPNSWAVLESFRGTPERAASNPLFSPR